MWAVYVSDDRISFPGSEAGAPGLYLLRQKVETKLPLVQSALQPVGYQTLGRIVMFPEWLMEAGD